MKQILISCFVLFSHYGFSQTLTVNPANASVFENRTHWLLNQNGEKHSIQNVSGKLLHLEVWVDKFLGGSANTLSDGVYILCGQTVQQTSPGSGIVCDLPYPGVAMIVAYPFLNGASGQFSLAF
jgi:hypothetical protein